MNAGLLVIMRNDIIMALNANLYRYSISEYMPFVPCHSHTTFDSPFTIFGYLSNRESSCTKSSTCEVNRNYLETIALIIFFPSRTNQLAVMHIIILQAEGRCQMRVEKRYSRPTFYAYNIEYCLCSVVMYMIAKKARGRYSKLQHLPKQSGYYPKDQAWI